MTYLLGNPWLSKVERTKTIDFTRYGKYRLDKNEWVGEYPELITAVVKEALSSEIFAAYPETHSLYSELSLFHQISRDSIHLTAGIDGAIKNCFEVFTQPGSEVVTISPTYAMVDVYCRLFNVRQTKIEYDQNLCLEFDHIINTITSSTSLVIIANPNSPTGTAMPIEELSVICDKCNALKVPILVDEAYYGFSNFSMEGLLPRFESMMIARTFSKAFGLAGFRVGYIISNPSLIFVLSRFMPMYEVTGPGVVAAKAMLRNFNYVKEYCNQVVQSKSFLQSNLRSKSVPYLSTYTNFIHIDFGINKDMILSELKKSCFLLQGGIRMDSYDSYSRVSVGSVSMMKSFWSSIQGLL
jgi:histidinol-phosphate aminotransferase